MFLFKRVKIRSFEVGLCFRDGEFQHLLSAGHYWMFDPFRTLQIDVVSQRAPWLVHDKLDVIVKRGMLAGRAEVVDLKDYERALVWMDGRFSQILAPGLYAYWTGVKDMRVEIVDARQVRFQHADFKPIARSQHAAQVLDICTVERNHVGVSFQDGDYVETLPPGEHAFWRNVAASKVIEVDLREQTIDIAGQEIMTADKVTLRMNAVVTYRIVDARQTVTVSDGATQSWYREAQLALRAVVGTRDLDTFLTEKDAVTNAFAEAVRRRAGELGLESTSVGVRDILLPGEMKNLMNKVTEANLIVRREETAAMRSQANTAKVLADNPTLMRLRELEVLEKVATSGKHSLVLGENGLADRVMNLL